MLVLSASSSCTFSLKSTNHHNVAEELPMLNKIGWFGLTVVCHHISFYYAIYSSPCIGLSAADRAVERMAFLDSSLVTKGKLIENLTVEYNFGWKGSQVHHTEDREEWKWRSRHNGLQKSTLRQLRELVSRDPWDNNIKDKGIQETWQLSKENIKSRKQSIHMWRRAWKHSKRQCGWTLFRNYLRTKEWRKRRYI